MRFFSAMELGIGMDNLPERIRSLSRHLAFFDDAGHSKQNAFREACERQDDDTVNQMLNEALCARLHTKEPIYALSQYCERFDIRIDGMSRMLDMEIVSAVVAHRDEILKRLSQEGV